MNASPAHPDPRSELQSLLASRIPLLVVESRDEARVLGLLRDASLKVRQPHGWGVFVWTATDGLKRIDVDMGGAQKTVSDPAQLLRHVKATPVAGIYILIDFHPYLGDPLHVRMLKDIAQGYDELPRTVVLLSHEIPLPVELESIAAHFRLAFPTINERHMLVTKVVVEWQRAHPGRLVAVDPSAQTELVENLSGLSAVDAEQLVRRVIFDDGSLNAGDVATVRAAKYKLLNRGGTLSYEPDTAKFADIGGLKGLRRWIEARRSAFNGSATKLDSPRGVLLLGVQGCGKSLGARATAGLFGVPLVRCDFGSLYSKWHGESEKNLRESLASAEALAPCVLWIDEIEKALATGDGDSGTSQRVLGTFLTWLAEHRARVFVVATANDISALPPELVRKGRFDEIFFVDLPDADARSDILAIHARRRGLEIEPKHAAQLATLSAEFSGAELEQAVVSALYSAHAMKQQPSAAMIALELRKTRPLAVVMGEKVAALREWAKGRTVSAD